MRKVFQRELFSRNVLRDRLAVGAMVVGTMFGAATSAVLAEKLVDDYRNQREAKVIAAQQAADAANEQEVIQILRESVSHMDLSPEESERLCREHDLPHAIFEPAPTAELAK